jgi:addiction module HigA family antidote
VLREEYLVPLGLSARALAKALGVPANRVSEIMRGTRDVSADTAIRLGRYFGTDPRFWLNLQTAHDLSKAEKARSYPQDRAAHGGVIAASQDALFPGRAAAFFTLLRRVGIVPNTAFFTAPALQRIEP